MESVLYKKYQDTLRGWCKGEEFDLAHAILIAGVAEDVNISQIEELIQTVHCWGRVRVRGRTYSVEAGGLLVLCECKEEIKPQTVPPEVQSDDGTTVWHIVVVDPRPDSSDASDDFVGKLHSFLQAEGKTVADLQDYVATSAPAKGTEEFFIHAMAEVMKQSNRSMAESHSYHRLGVFSGITPTPMGEEQVSVFHQGGV
ncbi:modulator of apoptosis 1-like [Ctenopharyngodon idella]|uniref:modulator of apoptosis 1-like n=1 Tax=Ctenopharyngodon idella TaxID=7959 RepID=UPI00222E156E|nr:modulator of apoptosis 1-like [Ctenopharyngodon idella]